MSRNHRILLAVMAAKMTFAQTQIHLPSQARDVDFSAAQSTKPAQTGNSLPASCSTGAVFVLLSNLPGQNVYVCTSTNAWTLQGGAGPNVLAVNASGTVMSIGSGCVQLAPCNVRVGGTVFAFTNGMTATLTGGSGPAYVFVASSGLLVVGGNLALTCAGGCVAQTGITGFPADSYPLAVWTATNGVWSDNGTDARSLLGRDLVIAGSGLTAGSSGGATTVSAPAQVGGFAASFRGSDTTAGANVYLTVPYACTITDWTISSDGTATIQLWRVPDGGTALPSSADSLSNNGFSLAAGTRLHSTNLSDLSSTSIFAFDTFAVNLSAVSAGTTHVEFLLGCTR